MQQKSIYEECNEEREGRSLGRDVKTEERRERASSKRREPESGLDEEGTPREKNE